MKRFGGSDIFMAAGLLTLLIGLTTAAMTLRASAVQRRHLAQKVDTLLSLQGLHEHVLDDQRAVTAFERLGRSKPVNLAEVLASPQGVTRPEIRPRDRQQLLPGWLLRRQEVNLTEWPLQDLARLIEQAETQRPPWRLVECTLTASAQTPGVASATLLVEAIEKQ